MHQRQKPDIRRIGPSFTDVPPDPHATDRKPDSVPSAGPGPRSRPPRGSRRPGWIKTALVLACCGAVLALPSRTEAISLHPATYVFAFVLPLLSLVANPVGRQWFRNPDWWRDSVLSRNRLAAAQFGAVFFAAVSAALWMDARLREAPTPDLVWLGIAFGGGYALAVPLAMPLRRKAGKDQDASKRQNRNDRS